MLPMMTLMKLQKQGNQADALVFFTVILHTHWIREQLGAPFPGLHNHVATLIIHQSLEDRSSSNPSMYEPRALPSGWCPGSFFFFFFPLLALVLGPLIHCVTQQVPPHQVCSEKRKRSALSQPSMTINLAINCSLDPFGEADQKTEKDRCPHDHSLHCCRLLRQSALLVVGDSSSQRAHVT